MAEKRRNEILQINLIFQSCDVSHVLPRKNVSHDQSGATSNTKNLLPIKAVASNQQYYAIEQPHVRKNIAKWPGKPGEMQGLSLNSAALNTGLLMNL